MRIKMSVTSRCIRGGSILAMGILIGFAFAPTAHAQTDSFVAVVADAQGISSVASDELPPAGTYWEVRNSLPCLTVPLPFPPADTNLVVYDLGDGQFLVDETAGPLVAPLPSAYLHGTLSAGDYAAIVEAQTDELQSIMTQVQARQMSGRFSRDETMDTDPPWPPGGLDGPPDPGGGMGFNGVPHGTNQLWIELLTPFATNGTASLVIHPPWNWDLLTGTYDLQSCTNLTPPIAWQWLMRTDPGQTNLTVSVTDPQRFYRLSLPNDLIANDSLGTNFWIAFFAVDNINVSTNLSVYISSPVGATGMVTVTGLGITNAFSVGAGEVTNVALDASVMMVDYGVVETNGVHITASRPVAVYGMDFSSFLTSAFTGYPVTLLGTNYCLMARAAPDRLASRSCRLIPSLRLWPRSTTPRFTSRPRPLPTFSDMPALIP